MLLLQLSLTDDGRHSKHTDTDCRVTDIRRIQTTHLHLQAANNTTCTLHTATCMHSTFNFSKTNAANMNYRVSQKSEPLNILQQQPQMCWVVCPSVPACVAAWMHTCVVRWRHSPTSLLLTSSFACNENLCQQIRIPDGLSLWTPAIQIW